MVLIFLSKKLSSWRKCRVQGLRFWLVSKGFVCNFFSHFESYLTLILSSFFCSLVFSPLISTPMNLFFLSIQSPSSIILSLILDPNAQICSFQCNENLDQFGSKFRTTTNSPSKHSFVLVENPDGKIEVCTETKLNPKLQKLRQLSTSPVAFQILANCVSKQSPQKSP